MLRVNNYLVVKPEIVGPNFKEFTNLYNEIFGMESKTAVSHPSPRSRLSTKSRLGPMALQAVRSSVRPDGDWIDLIRGLSAPSARNILCNDRRLSRNVLFQIR